MVCGGNKGEVKGIIVAEGEGLYTKADATRSNASKRITCTLVYCQSTRRATCVWRPTSIYRPKDFELGIPQLDLFIRRHIRVYRKPTTTQPTQPPNTL